MKSSNKIIAIIIIFLSCYIVEAGADIIYLKNGRLIKGLIKRENSREVVLELGFGTIKLSPEEIKAVWRSSPEEAELIRAEWQKYKRVETDVRQPKKEAVSGEAGISKTNEGILVNALLNNKVKASLILDTGAYGVLLSKKIGKELGIDTKDARKSVIEKVTMADGREAEARMMVLNSVAVEGVEAKNVEGAILLGDEINYDGLLGRSFLNKFSFQIDSANKKLILKEQKPQDVLEKTKYFNVICPSDWEKSIEGEKLTIIGPALPETESGIRKPYIIIEKDKDAADMNFAKEIKEWFARQSSHPDVKNKMLKLLDESFQKSNPQIGFISSVFEEKPNAIMVGWMYLFKKFDEKVYKVQFIKKDPSVGSYSLEFVCVDKYFNEYLPVFNKCRESFTSNE